MFIAMNRFKVIKGSEAAFENVWPSRDSYLEKVPGFVEFHLLKGPEAEDHTLYASSRKTVLCLKRGPNLRHSVQPTRALAVTSPSILDTRSLRVSRLFRQ